MKFRLLAVLCLFSGIALAQGVRFGDERPAQSTMTIPGGGKQVVIPLSGATINFCNNPASGSPCTNKATTFTDSTMISACPSNKQVVLANTNTCVSATDAQGNWGVWVAPGTYTYTITSTTGANSGPFPGTTGGAGGLGTPASLPGTLLLSPNGLCLYQGNATTDQLSDVNGELFYIAGSLGSNTCLKIFMVRPGQSPTNGQVWAFNLSTGFIELVPGVQATANTLTAPNVVIPGATSGQSTITAPATGGGAIALPAGSGTICLTTTCTGTLAGLTALQDMVATGATTATSEPRACNAGQSAPGAGICERIKTCVTNSGDTKRVGTIDARGYPVGAQLACNVNPFGGSNKSGLVLWPAADIYQSVAIITPQKKMRNKGQGQASPLSSGNGSSAENTIFHPCTGVGTPIAACGGALRVANNQLFIEPVYNLLASNGCTETATTVTCTTTAAHNYTFGSPVASRVVIAGSSVGGYNGTWTVTAVPTTTTFTFTTGAGLANGNGGTVTAPARQHGLYSLTGSGLTGADNYYAMWVLGGGNNPPGYDGLATCGTGPVGADYTLSAFGSTMEEMTISNDGLAGVIGAYSGNIQERGGFINVTFMNYGGAAAGQTEGDGFMFDRNAYNLNDKCANNSGNGGPSHFTIQNIYCDASPVNSAFTGICGQLAGNHTESDGIGAGGLAQYGIQCPGTIRGLNSAGLGKSNFGFWIQNYDDGLIQDCHFENLNADPIRLSGVNGWTSKGWTFSNLDYASSSGANTGLIRLATGTDNNMVLMVRASIGGNPSGVWDEVYGCGPAWGAAPPCKVNGLVDGAPVTMYVQGGMNIYNGAFIGNQASGSNPFLNSGTGIPAGSFPNGSLWMQTNAAGYAANLWNARNGTFFSVADLMGTGTLALSTSAIASGTCNLQSPAATAATAGDAVQWSFTTDPNGVTGYAGSSTGARLDIYAFATNGAVNFDLCNNTAGSITPGAITVKYGITK